MDKVQAFRDCVGSVAGGGVPSMAETDMLREVAGKYPWFMTGRIMLSVATGEEDGLLGLHFSAYPRPAVLLEDISLEELGLGLKTKSTPGVETPHDYLIDRFLAKGEYRIIPDESTTEEDVSAASVSFDADDDMVSEELAGIYLAQGLTAQAKEIYGRLSLLNPEKSIYFAEIIERIDIENSAKNE